jgi:hypothetical protein
MIKITPKCYYLKTTRPTEVKQNEVKKMKGVSVGLNPDITLENYKSCLERSIPKQGYNPGFKIIVSDIKSHQYEMIKYEQTKNALNNFDLDKMVILPNHACAPYLPGLLSNKDYIVKYGE